MALNITYDANELNKKLNSKDSPKENIIEKYLRENPTGQEKVVVKPAMWEDLNDLYFEIALNLDDVTQAIMRQTEHLKESNYISEKYTKLLQMYERDLSQIVADINDFRKRHTVDGSVMGEAKKGVVPVDELADYFLLGEEYKELGMRTVQLFQPIMLELTDISLSVKSQQVHDGNKNKNEYTDVTDKTVLPKVEKTTHLDTPASIEDWVKDSVEKLNQDKPALIKDFNDETSSVSWYSEESK